MLQRGFLSRRHPIRLSRAQILFGTGIGIGYAFLFYQVAIGIREVVRLGSFEPIRITYMHLTAQEEFYHNWFIAFWACLIGFSNAVDYWTTTSRHLGLHRYLILNESRQTLWLFNYWFVKLAWLYMALCLFLPVYRTFNFYRDYWFLFPMLAFVVFTSQWLQIRRRIANSFRMMCIVGAVFVCLSATLALLPVFPAAVVNELAQSQGPGVNFTLPPSSQSGRRVMRKSAAKSVYLGTDSNGSLTIVDDDREKYHVENIPELVLKTRQESIDAFGDHDWQENSLIQLYADRAVKTGIIKELMNGFRYANFYRVQFVTDTIDFDLGVITRLSATCQAMIPPEYVTDETFTDCGYMASDFDRSDWLSIGLVKDTIKVAGQPVDPMQLYQAARTHLTAGTCQFAFDIDDNSTYASLVVVYDVIFKANDDLRVELVKKELKLEYDEYDPRVRRFISETVPLYVVQWTDKEWDMMARIPKKKIR